MHAIVGADETTLRKLSFIIADLLVNFTNSGGSAPGAGMQVIASPLLCGHWRIRSHWHAARITALSALRSLTSGRTTPPSSARRLIPKQYLSKARSLDHQLLGTARGTVGPIEAKLLEYGALDGLDAHAVVGLVLGAFGEFSTSCYSLCTSIARVAAARL